MRGPLPGGGVVEAAVLSLVAIVALSFPFIDLELAVDLGGWHANAPLADVAALALLPLALLGARLAPIPLPGARGYALFLAASAASVLVAIDRGAALHHLVRKPALVYALYGVGLAWAIARATPPRWFDRLVLASVTLCSAVSLATSAVRITGGDALWFDRLDGLTPNHKTLAVCLSGILPLVLAGAGRARGVVAALAIAAIAASASKAAWITGAFSVGLFWPAGRPVSLRPRLVGPLLIAALIAALYAPVLVGSKAMLDAARSRHSLNVRAWEMFASNPLIGAGTGMNVEIEMVTFPHYRVNGVDAHGALQKVASETGLLGLAGFAWFTWATGAALKRRWEDAGRPRTGPEAAAFGAWLALHVNLLLSTETLSPTHWVPLGLAWGLAWRAREDSP